MIDQNLANYIAGLSTDAGQRVHIGNAPQNTDFPAVVIRRTGGNTPRVLGGQALFSRASFSIDVIGKDYATVMPVVTEIRVALDGFTGPMTDTTVQSARCLADPVDLGQVDGDLTLRVMSQEFSFVYLEA